MLAVALFSISFRVPVHVRRVHVRRGLNLLAMPVHTVLLFMM